MLAPGLVVLNSAAKKSNGHSFQTFETCETDKIAECLTFPSVGGDNTIALIEDRIQPMGLNGLPIADSLTLGGQVDSSPSATSGNGMIINASTSPSRLEPPAPYILSHHASFEKEGLGLSKSRNRNRKWRPGRMVRRARKRRQQEQTFASSAEVGSTKSDPSVSYLDACQEGNNLVHDSSPSAELFCKNDASDAHLDLGETHQFQESKLAAVQEASRFCQSALRFKSKDLEPASAMSPAPVNIGSAGMLGQNNFRRPLFLDSLFQTGLLSDARRSRRRNRADEDENQSETCKLQLGAMEKHDQEDFNNRPLELNDTLCTWDSYERSSVQELGIKVRYVF
ncbi:unnamed protein product [Protopolystoma xenopodis]|uniref:Uncharacterized protein n=1 Tax=Protopolystoma xenopodis TaxID=117903 RepID=A0A3S5FDU6_9PLAT|nr:unnamed protein product [Protopolystoma xenopodis]